MSNSNHSGFQFDDYFVTRSKFELNFGFKSSSDIKLEYKLRSEFHISDDLSSAIVSLDCSVFGDTDVSSRPFTLETEIVGNFLLDGDFQGEEIQHYCKVNATAILYPYLRAYITNLTSLAGVTPLILPTVNVVKMIEENDKSTSQE